MGCIHDETVFDRGKFVTDAIPDGLEALAVATPEEAISKGRRTTVKYFKQAHQVA